MSLSDFSPLLGLPYLLSNQSQRHVTVNESLRLLDGLVQLSVRSRSLATPPETPIAGDRYLVAADAIGEWIGQAGSVALFSDGGWLFLAPVQGWRVWVEDEGALLVLGASGWRSAMPDAIQELTRLGIGGTADAANPLLAKLNASLLTALDAGSGGSGDLRFKLNKEAEGNILSLLFQTGYATRAEMGLVGDDDLVVKTSPDGSTFHEAIRIDKTDGRVRFPSGTHGLRELLSSDRTYYVNASTGSDANDGRSPGTAFASIQKAIDAVGQIDLGIFNATISVAIGTYAGFIVNGPFMGQGNVTISGDTTTPSNCEIIGSAEAVSVLNGGVVNVEGLYLNCTSRQAYVFKGSLLTFTGKFAVGACASGHFEARDAGAAIEISADYEITGAAPRHWYALYGGWLRSLNRTITVTGAQAYSVFAFANIGAIMHVSNNTFAGDAASTTGTRYTSKGNSTILTSGGGATYLPGNVAGSSLDGGIYI